MSIHDRTLQIQSHGTGLIILLLLDSKKFPAGPIVAGGGLIAGLVPGAGSNLFIGLIFAGPAIVLGNSNIDFLKLLPMSVLGILLIFAGARLALTIMDLKTRKDFFVVAMIPGITLASNLAAGFLTGIVVAHVLRWNMLSV